MFPSVHRFDGASFVVTGRGRRLDRTPRRCTGGAPTRRTSSAPPSSTARRNAIGEIEGRALGSDCHPRAEPSPTSDTLASDHRRVDAGVDRRSRSSRSRSRSGSPRSYRPLVLRRERTPGCSARSRQATSLHRREQLGPLSHPCCVAVEVRSGGRQARRLRVGSDWLAPCSGACRHSPKTEYEDRERARKYRTGQRPRTCTVVDRPVIGRVVQEHVACVGGDARPRTGHPSRA